MKPDRQRMKTLLAEAITTLCRNGLSYDSELCVEGLLGITLDNNEIFLVNVNETFKAAAAKDAQSTDSGGVESAKTSAISPPAPVHRSVVPVRRPHYGKSPMYRPGFTPSHHRLHKRSSGFSRTPRPIPTRPKEVVEIKDDDDQTNVEQTGDMSLDLQVENVPGEYSQYEQMTGVTESGRGATSDSEVSQSENYEPPAKRLTVDSQSTEESCDIKDSNKGTDQDNGVAKSESPGDVSSPSRTEKIPVDVTLSLGDEIKIKEEISEITEEIVQYSASSNASQTFISRSNTHSRHAQEYVPLQTGYSPGQHSGSDSSTGGQPGGMRMLVRPTEYPIPTSQDSSPGQGTQMSPVAGCSTWDNNAGSMQNTSGQGSSGAVSQGHAYKMKHSDGIASTSMLTQGSVCRQNSLQALCYLKPKIQRTVRESPRNFEKHRYMCQDCCPRVHDNFEQKRFFRLYGPVKRNVAKPRTRRGRVQPHDELCNFCCSYYKILSLRRRECSGRHRLKSKLKQIGDPAK